MNPFTLSFGVVPEQFIARDEIKEQIFNDFNSSRSESNVYILKGVRGAGKTVMLNYLRKEFEDNNDWIVINVNPEMDILESVAAKLYEKGSIKHFFLKPTFNFSFNGIGFSIKGETPIKNIETLLEKMIDIVDSKKKKVLITIDEVANKRNMQVFSHTFKNLVNDGKPIYLLATGLNENISSLQNEKTLTFFYRARKIDIKPLNINAIARSYKNVLGLDELVALKCALLTDGYASAYQILGSILFNTKKKDIDEEVLAEFDILLAEINYDKLWDDLSQKDKMFLYGFKEQRNNKIMDVMKASGISKESFSKYRDRLLKRGVIVANTHGYLSLNLPRLINYIEFRKKMDSLL